MKKIIAGNWKMFGSPESVKLWAAEMRDFLAKNNTKHPITIICPPAPLITLLASELAGTNIKLGGQDCHAEAQGAHTGDTSATLLKTVGCDYVIVGHSERRTNHAESSEIVCEKAQQAINNGLIPIICIGETADERKHGKTIAVINEQIEKSVPQISEEGEFILAYEPVWAIGSGNVPSSDEIADAHAAILSATNKRTGLAQASIAVLYGGSVKPDNSQEIMKIAGVSGVLVGGASLKAEDFFKIFISAE